MKSSVMVEQSCLHYGGSECTEMEGEEPEKKAYSLRAYSPKSHDFHSDESTGGLIGCSDQSSDDPIFPKMASTVSQDMILPEADTSPPLHNIFTSEKRV